MNMRKIKMLCRRIGVGVLAAVLLAGYIPNLPVLAAEPVIDDVELAADGEDPEASEGTDAWEELPAFEEDSEQAPEDNSEPASETLEEKERSEEEALTEDAGTSEETASEETTSEETASEETASEEAGETDETDEIGETDESSDKVFIGVEGPAIVEGLDEENMAKLGDRVSIEVTEPGYNLALLSRDEKGNPIYTAMNLDYGNSYEFVVDGEKEFFVLNADEVDFAVRNAAATKAMLTGEAALKLVSLESSAQGCKEIVLNFTPVANGSNRDDRNNSAYYEVKVEAIPDADGNIPEGSLKGPKYLYVLKGNEGKTDSKSIVVNTGNATDNTACTYEFTVRMVYGIPRLHEKGFFDEIPASSLSITAGNSITKRFSTKNLYYEDKLGFTKKNTTIFTGQENVLAGIPKYSKNASFIHNLSAVAYDKEGKIEERLTFRFRNDNDELYMSADYRMKPGTYKVVVYAGIGEENTVSNPQTGTMYQSNTSFNVTVKSSIYSINVSERYPEIALDNKNASYKLSPVGKSYQGEVCPSKFRYEIYSASIDEGGHFHTPMPNDNVKNNVTVDKNGKVSIKKSFEVDPVNEDNNWFAVDIIAADYPGSYMHYLAYFHVKAQSLVPKEIILKDRNGNKIPTTLPVDQIHRASVVVLDQNGDDITNKVRLTPKDNAKYTAKAYVSGYGDNKAIYFRKIGTYTIKATTMDGSNRSVSLKVKAIPANFTEIHFSSVHSYYEGVSTAIIETNIETPPGVYLYRAPKGAGFSFNFSADLGDYPYSEKEWFNWKYSVQGGRLIDTDYDYYLIPTSKVCKVKVWSGHNPKVSETLTFKSTQWNKSMKKMKLKRVDKNTLYVKPLNRAEDMPSGNKIPKQEVTFRYEGVEFKCMEVFEEYNAPELELVSVNSEDKTITLSAAVNSGHKAGTYRYKIHFYDSEDFYGRENVCKPVEFKLTYKNPPAVKVTGSYTMDLSKGNSVTLKSTPAGFIPNYDKALLNANVGGKANDFNQYFELVYVKDTATGKVKEAQIQLKGTLTEEQKASLKGKTMTGYVRYDYYCGNSLIMNSTAKVSIKIK